MQIGHHTDWAPHKLPRIFFDTVLTNSIHGMRALTAIDLGSGSLVTDVTMRKVKSPVPVRLHAHAGFQRQAPMTSHTYLSISIVDQ